MSKLSPTLFDGARMTLDDSLDLTAQSIRGGRYSAAYVREASVNNFRIQTVPGCQTADLLIAVLRLAQAEEYRKFVVDVLDLHFHVCGCGAIVNLSPSESSANPSDSVRTGVNTPSEALLHGAGKGL